jgi:hypothetical protein
VRRIKRRKSRTPFDITVKRRREIESYGKYVDAADTADFWRWLVAWLWHYHKPAEEQQWAVIQAAERMGGKLTEAKAADVVAMAAEMRRHLTADRLARFLGLKYAVRQHIGITTIGAVDVNKQARKAIRQGKCRLYQEHKRRAQGNRPRTEYESQSIAAQARKEGVSRMTIYRRRQRGETVSETLETVSETPATVSVKNPNKQAMNVGNVTGPSTAEYLNAAYAPVTSARRGRGNRGWGLNIGNQENRESLLSPSRSDGSLAVDGLEHFETLAIELRMTALCLPFKPLHRLRRKAA